MACNCIRLHKGCEAEYNCNCLSNDIAGKRRPNQNGSKAVDRNFPEASVTCTKKCSYYANGYTKLYRRRNNTMADTLSRVENISVKDYLIWETDAGVGGRKVVSFASIKSLPHLL